FFITLSDSLKHAGFKWLLSLPISLVWIFFIRTGNFNRRILNWLMPEFGEPNIGALGLAAITLMIYASVAVVAFGVGLGISGAIADRKSERFYNIISVMKKICAVVSIILAAVILLLDMGMPAYRPVYG
ncbi:MAG: hypothetical protein K2H90_07240, partial [Oscillospiraceae bacterium]|nr:hypothetical protein [Oscillospiraceae bacterium]